MSNPEIPSRQEVERLYRPDGQNTIGVAFNDRIWIKYGIYVRLSEAAIQKYVHEHADPRIVRVLKVFDAFTLPRQHKSRPVTYIIMEYVEGDDFSNFVTYSKNDPQGVGQAIEAIAAAVRHIWDIPPPPNATPGPFGQDIPVDRFFSDCGANRTFNNLIELEDWINALLEDADRPDRVTLQDEELFVCHCDLTQFNIKKGEPIAIIDFGFSGIYPRAFEEFALVHQFVREGAKFAKALHKELFGPKLSKSMRAFAFAARYHAFGC